VVEEEDGEVERFVWARLRGLEESGDGLEGCPEVDEVEVEGKGFEEFVVFERGVGVRVESCLFPTCRVSHLSSPLSPIPFELVVDWLLLPLDIATGLIGEGILDKL